MADCWAQCLGGCSDKMSREHLISESLFLDPRMTVHGFPWCKDKPVVVGLASLTAKILCKKHNSDLTDLDEAGGNAFGILREIRRVANIRGKKPNERWSLIRYEVEGALFERWCLKTLINLCFGREYPVGRDSTTQGWPSERLVRLAYGHEEFKGNAGLYFVVRTGMQMQSEDRVSFAPLCLAQKVEGGLFSIRGLRFFLSLEEEGPPRPLSGILIDDEDLGRAQMRLRMTEMRVKDGKFLSQILTFKW